MSKMNNKSKMESVISKIFAITTQCLMCGHLPTEKEKLMALFKNVDATEEEIIELAKTNKLEWVYDIHCHVSKQEYTKSMNESLHHYLTRG